VITVNRLFPTGGKAHEPIQWHDPVKFRGRRYSPDERRTLILSDYVVMNHAWQHMELDLLDKKIRPGAPFGAFGL
jgi:hypothetical protein